MNTLLATFGSPFAIETPRELPSRALPLAGAVLRALDIAMLALAGCLALAVTRHELALRDLLIAAFFLTFAIDCVGGYRPACLHRLGALSRSAAVGAAIVFGALLAVGLVMDAGDAAIGAWQALWLLLSFAALIGGRAVFWIACQRLVAAGRLNETVAIVGVDAESLRLAGTLSRERGRPRAVVGVFSTASGASDPRFAGSIEDLVRLGQARSIDKIIVAGASSGEPHVQRMIHALKSLAVDILLAPPGSTELAAA
jgi:hypothetical protein